ncbi:unnamed protein product [Heterotrigona itama]|uniref:Uncharacterized protein n=1 Tax=Heterotrigona itama TaxID=395501 RepID=A0A6V7HES0_9HYME|nr:unnamed protein product [Heterotrigona itama]
MARLLQCNLNHSARAQDHAQTKAECSIELTVVAELYQVPDSPDCVGDVLLLLTAATSSLWVLKRGRVYVATAWALDVVVVEIYALPPDYVHGYVQNIS